MENSRLDYDEQDQSKYCYDSMLDIFYSGNNNDEEVYVLDLDGTRKVAAHKPMDYEDSDNNDSNEPSTSSNPVIILPPITQVINKSTQSMPPETAVIAKPRKKREKRSCNPEIWKINAERIKRNLGLQFINRAGTVRKAKQLKPPCKETCAKRCWESLTENDRIQLFTEFWGLGDPKLQLQYLSDNIEKLEKKRLRGKTETSRRKWTYCYYFSLNERRLNVCKMMFVNTLIISDSLLKTTIRKKEEAESGVPKRRKYKNRTSGNYIPEEMKKIVRKHVLDIHFAESKYISTKSLKKYFEEHLTYKRLYKLYCDWFRNNKYSNELKASASQYRYVIVNEYKLRFFTPKKKSCWTCTSYKISSDEDKLARAEQHSYHLASEYTSRQLKWDCKASGKVNTYYVVATYNFQRDLITPMSDKSVFYYKRKLAAYNFTIYDIGRKEGYCYIWDETVGKKGLNEICSAVYSFIELKVSQGAKEFVFFSDNCGNPDRSPAIFTMYYYAAHKFKVDISHIFFESGHTQMPEDTMMLTIEKAKNDTEIFVPDEWVSLLKNASPENPYKVIVMAQNTILDFKNFFSSLPNVDFDFDGVKINWDDINHVRIIKDCSYMKLGYKLYAEEVIFIDFLNKPDSLVTDFNELIIPFTLPKVLERAYVEPFLISAEKYNDLETLCEKKDIPVQYHEFYRNLKYKETNEENLFNIQIDSFLN
ncbi:uncharacterized protein LOC113491796 [Trichoplusia ni]|uniref:Uncharacterized protein LOC113491796 n=1 Tax=Trichoplusia ni TaxID=7111 RepID=A0A7E5V8Z6_TRINI|nr:uncharacterized protein LOC113491796 [Trichoplusia ni]